jgi:hypothetical protein
MWDGLIRYPDTEEPVGHLNEAEVTMTHITTFHRDAPEGLTFYEVFAYYARRKGEETEHGHIVFLNEDLEEPELSNDDDYRCCECDEYVIDCDC